MAEGVKKTRPEYRNIGIAQLGGYRLPPSGKVSILHRISGALLFLTLPFSLYLLEQSLTSEFSFDAFKTFASHPLTKLVILAVTWAYLFHFMAGLRHLLMDTHVAVNKKGGKNTALVVLTLSTLATVVVALKLFGAF